VDFEREIARERGRVDAQLRVLSEEDLPQIRVLMNAPDASISLICERFDVSKAMLYRYVGSDGERRK
jgi:hypothetical protein